MTEKNNQPVDLKQVMERKNKRTSLKEGEGARKKIREENLDNIYNGEENKQDELGIIKRDEGKKINSSAVFVVFLVILLGVFGFWLSKKSGGAKITQENQEVWYAVTLSDNEMFYGLIADTAADPVVIRDVYYNYDKKEDGSPSGNLRLVKRGKEAHGPTGSINIVRGQIKYMEPLKDDSKVLKAILENEK